MIVCAISWESADHRLLIKPLICHCHPNPEEVLTLILNCFSDDHFHVNSLVVSNLKVLHSFQNPLSGLNIVYLFAFKWAENNKLHQILTTLSDLWISVLFTDWWFRISLKNHINNSTHFVDQLICHVNFLIKIDTIFDIFCFISYNAFDHYSKVSDFHIYKYQIDFLWFLFLLFF
jgi:hypothetical protein